jgi:hypothetical protein
MALSLSASNLKPKAPGGACLRVDFPQSCADDADSTRAPGQSHVAAANHRSVGMREVLARGGWAVACFAALALFFLALLWLGMQSGELWVPLRGFAVSVQRASNPSGFWATAAIYAALTGLASYPLALLLRPARGAHGVPVQGLPGHVTVTTDGRSGTVRVSLHGGHHDFWWEFGGGDCLAIVTVPSADEWAQLPRLAKYPREPFLAALAREIRRQQCPQARYEIEPRAIVFRQA